MFFMYVKLNFVYLWVLKYNFEKDEVVYFKMGRERLFLNFFRRFMYVYGLVWRGCFFVYVYVIYIFVLVFKEFGNFVGIRICI